MLYNIILLLYYYNIVEMNVQNVELIVAECSVMEITNELL